MLPPWARFQVSVAPAGATVLGEEGVRDRRSLAAPSPAPGHDFEVVLVAVAPLAGRGAPLEPHLAERKHPAVGRLEGEFREPGESESPGGRRVLLRREDDPPLGRSLAGFHLTDEIGRFEEDNPRPRCPSSAAARFVQRLAVKHGVAHLARTRSIDGGRYSVDRGLARS